MSNNKMDAEKRSPSPLAVQSLTTRELMILSLMYDIHEDKTVEGIIICPRSGSGLPYLFKDGYGFPLLIHREETARLETEGFLVAESPRSPEAIEHDATHLILSEEARSWLYAETERLEALTPWDYLVLREMSESLIVAIILPTSGGMSTWPHLSFTKVHDSFISHEQVERLKFKYIHAPEESKGGKGMYWREYVLTEEGRRFIAPEQYSERESESGVASGMVDVKL